MLNSLIHSHRKDELDAVTWAKATPEQNTLETQKFLGIYGQNFRCTNLDTEDSDTFEVILNEFQFLHLDENIRPNDAVVDQSTYMADNICR